MGLFDSIGGGARTIGTTVLAKFKADTSDMRAELKRLRGEQRQMMRDQLDAIEKNNKSLDSQIAKWVKFTGVILAVGKAWDVAKASLARYEENTRLAATAGAVNIEALRKASRGLITETDLLRLAAADQTSALKMNQRQLEGVVGAMATLINEGKKSEDVIRDFTQSVAEEGSEALGKYGLAVQGAAKGQASFIRLVQESELVAKRFQENGATPMSRASVEWANAADQMSTAVGKLVSKLAPLISALARVVSLAASAGEELSIVFGFSEAGTARRIADLKARIERAKGGDMPYQIMDGLSGGILSRGGIGGGSDNLGELEAALAAAENNLRAEKRLAKAKADAAARKAAADAAARSNDAASGVGVAGVGAGRGGGGRPRSRLDAFDPSMIGMLGDGVAGGLPGLGGLGGGSQGRFDSLAMRGIDSRTIPQSDIDFGAQAQGIGLEAQAEWYNSMLERFLGNVVPTQSLLKGLMTDLSSTTVAAMGLMTGAVQSAYAAIVTGSSSASEAVKKFAGNWLLGEGTRLAGLSISAGVQALFQLAMGDFAGAGRSGIASAKAAAGAAALGLLAHKLGAGNGVAAKSVGAGSVGVGGGPRTTSTTIIIGDGFDTGSRRSKANRIGEWMRLADREAGAGGAGGFN